MSTELHGPISSNDYGDFIDSERRKITLKGINLDSSAKLPQTPDLPTDYPASNPNSIFWDGDNVSFVGRPFPLEEAEEHIKRIKSWGYNVIRYVITWEAIEHRGPKQYDDDFIEYTAKVLQVIQRIGGIYVFIDPHQDVWSRFTGGSGAPIWTLYAAGFDPRKFYPTQAAILHNYYPRDPDVYPKMLWPSNYNKLAAGTMFTLFFAGKIFAPNAIIDGVNIQDYLQDHWGNAIQYLIKKLKLNHPEFFEEMIFGVELLNEPYKGYFGQAEFNEIPESQKLRVGPTPTLYQSLILGQGYSTTVDEYKIAVTGPKKTGTVEVDPHGETAWLTTDKYDQHYQWKRDPNWQLGKCIWAQHGVWDIESKQILNQDYFAKHPQTGAQLDLDYFTNNNFVDYYIKYKNKIRAVLPDTYILLHSVVMQQPPKLVGTQLIDAKTIYAPHYYDGMSLMFKTWNRRYNVDTLGIVRGKYWNPIFGIVFGENNIRKCIRDQFKEIKREGKELLGENIPILMTETGMPFDMDNKQAYKDGIYDSQTSALDALGFALEGADISHTFWTYCSISSHKWGDRWNCEDFSFWSTDDQLKRHHPEANLTRINSNDSKTRLIEESENSFAVSRSSTNNSEDSNTVGGTHGEDGAIAEHKTDNSNDNRATAEGTRAVNSIVRPYAVRVNGHKVTSEFDLANRRFVLSVSEARKNIGNRFLATVVYLPTQHFELARCGELLDVKISSGKFIVDEKLRLLEWYHEGGSQRLEIETVKSKGSTSSGVCGVFRGLCDMWC